jgi:hypothetical protein
MLHLAAQPPRLKDAPYVLSRGAGDVGVGFAGAAAELSDSQKLDELVIVQIQLRLVAPDYGIYHVTEPSGAFLFVHLAYLALPPLQDSTARPQSSVNVRVSRV